MVLRICHIIFTVLYILLMTSNSLDRLIILVLSNLKISALVLSSMKTLKKKYIRKSERPLQQVMRRYREKEINSDLSTSLS